MQSREDLMKLAMGGCGSQIGMFAGCGTIIGSLVILVICALTGFLTISVNDFVREFTSLSNPTVAISDALDSSVVQVNNAAPAEETSRVPQSSFIPTEPFQPVPLVTAYDGNVNLRYGPGTRYAIIGKLLNNGSLEIIGRNPDATWWLVYAEDGPAWISNSVVSTSYLHDNIPVYENAPTLVPIGPAEPVPTAAPSSRVIPDASPILPSGTPIPSANEPRTYVKESIGYKQLDATLSGDPMSASFSPHRDPIILTEGVKLHLVAGDGSYSKSLLESNASLKLQGGVVWSPDGKFIAFVIENTSCQPCRSVAVMRMDTVSLWDNKQDKPEFFFLKTPNGLNAEAPRWTQDGRLLINVYQTGPADGTTYVYDTSGRGEVAKDLYYLSTSHDGQQWYPWQPGKTWQAGRSGRPDSYYQ